MKKMNEKTRNVQQIVIRHISEYTDVEEKDIDVSMTLGNDLGITSFDLVSLAYEFEEEFKAESEIDIPKDAETVGDLVEFVKNMLERY